MSYWVYLTYDNGTVPVEPHSEGGTYAMGGTSKAEINVTYNYSRVYPEYFSLRDLDGKTAAETELILAKAVDELGTERDEDYWNPTPGNAGYALNILLGWARQHPKAKWIVS